MLKKLLLAGIAAGLMVGTAGAKDLNKIGISLGSMGNPFFVALAKGAEAKAKEINPKVQVNALGFEYDLGKQVTQIDNFIASGVDMIMLNAADKKALAPAVKKAQAAGIVVVAVDVGSDGVDATVMTDNVQAGSIACQYIVDKLGGKGDVIIENGPQVTAVVDRVVGCKQVFAKNPGIKVLSDDQDAKGSREGGLNVMQALLTRFAKVDAVFAINDPQAIGSDLAAKQLKRTGIIITAVDGAPDIEVALKGDTQIQASASQDPYKMAQIAVTVGYDVMNGKKPEKTEILMDSKLVTRDNVKDYAGWSSH
ncbi:MAG: ABC transporter substrate-binding protein [Ancalomicrobiaceae bacterium]|nr:ABC transporter substrate-binding protein [Ancalomicrobiaceae bacterium]